MSSFLQWLTGNWKTTFAGVAVLALACAFVMGKITVTQFLTAFAALSGAGHIMSKDA